MAQIVCNEVWGGIGVSDEAVELAGLSGVCWSRPFQGGDRGGDIHLLSVCGSNILSKAMLADVSGHGGSAAVAAEVLHDAMSKYMDEPDNVRLLTAVNQRFLAHEDDELRFSTMVSVILDSRDRSFVYAYAGHPAILRSSAGGRHFWPMLPHEGPRGGVPVGVVSDVEYHEHRTTLHPGELIVLYSDAFTEARVTGGEMLGEDGLARLLEGAPDGTPRAIVDHVVSTLEGRLDDDATLMVFEVG